MSKSKITMIGLENFMQSTNDSLFSNMILPEELNRDDVINNILLRSGEFEVLYSDPYFLRDAISLWSRKNKRTFDKWYSALQIEYNPLENYDRMEDWEESEQVENSGSVTEAGTSTNNGNTTNTGTVDTVNTTGSTTDLTNSRSAYDSTAFVNDTKSDTVSSGTNDTTQTNNLSEVVNNTRTDNTQQDTTSHETTANARHGRLHGNIGVTTSQQMLESELDIAKWNLFEQIADLFISEFCIMVY